MQDIVFTLFCISEYNLYTLSFAFFHLFFAAKLAVVTQHNLKGFVNAMNARLWPPAPLADHTRKTYQIIGEVRMSLNSPCPNARMILGGR